ncbi:hypothetical protein PENTCL1PPCAC_15344, partial [Pristionchus entomophagus]
MHLRTWIFVLETVIIIPPGILYLIEIKILLTARGNEFSSPFYVIFLACSVTDIFGVILSHFFYALPMAPDWGDGYVAVLPIWSYSAANALLFYLPTVLYFLNIAIALNRLTSPATYLKLPVGDQPPVYLLYPLTLQTFPKLYFVIDPSSRIAGYIVQCLPWMYILKCLLHPILLFLTNAAIRHQIMFVRKSHHS